MVKRAIIKRRVKRKISAAPAPEIIKKNIKEENLQLSPKSTYSKLIAIFVLIITFSLEILWLYNRQLRKLV